MDLRRSLQRAAWVAATLLAAGCQPGPRVDLVEWSVDLDQRAAARTVALPAHLPALDAHGSRPTRFRLRRSASLPETWRGKPLTLSVVRLPAFATLRVNGARAQHLELDPDGAYRPLFPRRFRITADQSRTGALELELTLENTWTQSGWLDAVPQLSPAQDGGPGFNRLNDWNRYSSVLGLAATVLAAIIFFGIFLFNRARRDSGWFALQALGGGLYPALNLNLLQPLFGTWDVPIAGLGVSLAGLAGVHMMHALLKLGRPHWIWPLLWLGHLAAAVVFRSPFEATFIAGHVGGTLVGLAALYQMIRYAIAWHKQRQATALTLSLGWAALSVLAGIDILTWAGHGSLFVGWQGAGAGIFVIAVAQAINLSREHSRALAEALALTAKLSEKVQALEQSNLERERLGEELRHQVGVRSQQLAEILARAPAEGGSPRKFGVGDVINDRYRVESVIGSGGMGMVYRATRLSDSRTCALKVIKHRPSTEHLARLSREAMVLSQIRHPNIIEVLDINVSQSGQLYIVMELVQGRSLDTQNERFGDVAWALPVLGQMASALEAIHAKHVIHRDLKPANILLLDSEAGAREQVKVADFGLAGLVEGGAQTVQHLASTVEALTTTEPPRGPSLTQTGAIIGTPLYMAPEFVSGTKEIGPPADVFSFGVIAYEVLARARPFAELPIMAAVHGRAIVPQKPLAEACPGLAAPTGELLTRCLAADPGKRPPAHEVAVALEAP